MPVDEWPGRKGMGIEGRERLMFSQADGRYVDKPPLRSTPRRKKTRPPA
jgi:hypothetical protein